jgi:hypothetical protein
MISPPSPLKNHPVLYSYKIIFILSRSLDASPHLNNSKHSVSAFLFRLIISNSVEDKPGLFCQITWGSGPIFLLPPPPPPTPISLILSTFFPFYRSLLQTAMLRYILFKDSLTKLRSTKLNLKLLYIPERK